MLQTSSKKMIALSKKTLELSLIHGRINQLSGSDVY